MTHEKINTDQLLLLLKDAKHEEQQIRTAIRSTMNIYITLLVSIIGGIITILSIVGFAEQNRPICALILILGSLIDVCISHVAYRHYISDYKRQAETIVQQAKLEDVLGLTNGELYQLKTYWQGESLLPNNYVQIRKNSLSSDKFVEWFMENTDVGIARLLYTSFQVIGVLLFVMGVVFVFV